MPLIIAHRGASGAFTENTLEAFTAALEVGADWVELDIRRTGDGHVVVHHDPETADGRLIAETAVADLPDHISTLTEVLKACGSMGVNIEIKSDPNEADFDPSHEIIPRVVEVARTHLSLDKVLVSSFDMTAINAVRDLARTLPTAFLTSEAIGAEVAVGRASAHGHVAINPHDDIVTPRWVAEAHDAGLAVNVWTVDDPARMIELAEMEVEGIITNVPELAIETLR